jgi:chromosome segregation ATPase
LLTCPCVAKHNGPMSSDEKLDKVLQEIAWVKDGITNLGTKVDALERDNKWELVLEQMREIRSEITGLHSNMERGFRRIDHKLDSLNSRILDIDADHKELESRVDELEKKPA